MTALMTTVSFNFRLSIEYEGVAIWKYSSLLTQSYNTPLIVLRIETNLG